MPIIPQEQQTSIIPEEQELVESSSATDAIKAQGKIVQAGTSSVSERTSESNLLEYNAIKQESIPEIRQAAKALQIQRRSSEATRALQESLQGSDNQEIIQNNLKLLQQAQQENIAALEEEYTSIMDKESRNNPLWASVKAKDTTIAESARKKAAKQLVLNNKLQEVYSKVDGYDIGMNLLKEVGMVNFVSRLFEFGPTDYASELRALQTKIEQAEEPEEVARIFDESEELIRSAQIIGDNDAFVAETLQTAFTGTQTEQQVEGAFQILDSALALGGVIKGTKGILGLSGNTKAALDTANLEKVADEVVNGADGITVDGMERYAASQGLTPEIDDSPSLPPKVRQQAEVNQRVLQDVINNFTGVDYDEVTKLNILENTKKKLISSFNNGQVGNVKVVNDSEVEVSIFKDNGNPYASEGTARSAIKAKGLENAEPYQINGGAWGIKWRTPLSDYNDAKAMKNKPISMVSTLLRRPEAWVDSDLLQLGQISEGAQNQIMKAARGVYKDSLGKLNKNQMQTMESIFEMQRNKRTWFSNSQIKDAYRQVTGRNISDRELKAAIGYRQLNDFQYELDNKIAYQKAKAQGYGTLTEDTFGIRVNAKVANEDDVGRVFVPEDGTTLSDGGLIDELKLKYDILKIDRADRGDLAQLSGFDNFRANPTDYVAVPKGSAKIDELDYQQLNYVEGGRVRYPSSNTYIKQARVGEYADGGKYRLPDRTLFTASSFPQARRTADTMNEINRVLRKSMDDPDVLAEADKIVKARMPFGVDTIEEYIEKVNARGIDINDDVVPLRNRERINISEQYADLGGDFEDVVHSSGRLGRRGEDLVPHVSGDETKILSPLQALQENMGASANNAAFGAYRDYALEYMEKYRKHLEVAPNAPKIELLTAPVKKTPEALKLLKRIEGEQRFAREIVGRMSPQEMAAQQRLENMLEWALDRKIPLGRAGILKNPDEAVGTLSEKLSADPIGRLRSAVFNAKLGLFSLPAMLIQAAHAPIIAAMAPKYGPKALMTAPLLRTALLTRDPEAIKIIAKKAEKLEMRGYGDIEKFISEFRHHGFDHFGDNLAYVDAARGDNLISGTLGSIAEKGRIFFEEGELIPRMTGYSVAVREWLDNAKNVNPKGLAIDSKEGRRYINARTNTLTLGMTRADLQQGLKGGFTGLMFQFQSYPMRAIDAMFFPSKTLSQGERMRMAAGYLAMYGAAGLPLATSFANYVSDKFDKELELPEEFYKFLYNGVVDGMVMAASGEDTNFASRGGLGAWASEIIKSFTDERTSVLEVLTGPAGSTGIGSMDAIIEYSKAWSAGYNPDPDQLTGSVMMDVAKQISSFNSLYKTYVAFRTGMMYDSRGNQFAEISNKGALLSLFGLPPQAYEDMGDFFTSQKKRDDIVKLHTEMLVKQHMRFSQAETQEERQKAIEAINAISVYVQQDGLSQEVNSRVAREIRGNDLYDRLIKENLKEMTLGEKVPLPRDLKKRIEEQ